MHIRHRIQSTVTEIIAALVIAALIVVVPAPLLAQQKAAVATAKAAKPVVADEEEESTPASKKPGDDGIKVHGHWIIDVKDKDGKIVDHRDFQNALQTQGASVLAGLLLGQLVPDQALYVVVSGGTKDGYQMNGTNTLAAAACSIPTANHCLTNLTQLATSTGNGLTLTSQFQATVADTFTSVSTNLYVCYNLTSTAIVTDTIAPSACKAGFQTTTVSGSTPSNNSGLQFFTAKDLSATPLSVSAGQSVQVTVTLSFS